LRFLFLESGGGWIPTQLERMDEQVKAFPLEKRWLSLLPSEYFRRQCWAGFEPEEWNLAACAEWLGPDRVLWASDYPHPEFHPEVVKELRETIAPLPDDAQRKILGDNAIAAHKLPLSWQPAPSPACGAIGTAGWSTRCPPRVSPPPCCWGKPPSRTRSAPVLPLPTRPAPPTSARSRS